MIASADASVPSAVITRTRASTVTSSTGADRCRAPGWCPAPATAVASSGEARPPGRRSDCARPARGTVFAARNRPPWPTPAANPTSSNHPPRPTARCNIFSRLAPSPTSSLRASRVGGFLYRSRSARGDRDFCVGAARRVRAIAPLPFRSGARTDRWQRQSAGRSMRRRHAATAEASERDQQRPRRHAAAADLRRSSHRRRPRRD